MKTTMRAAVVVSCILTTPVISPLLGSDEVLLGFRETQGVGLVVLESRFALPVSSMYPEFQIERSVDMETWADVGSPFIGSVGVSSELLNAVVPIEGDHGLYRVRATIKLDATEQALGDSVFGYSTEFSRQLQNIGQLPLVDFIQQYNVTNQYLPQIDFNPTAAEFWDRFAVDPAVWNATNDYFNWRYVDFRLNPDEFAVIQTNGFVVSQRLGRESFADVYYDIYTDDLPVFVTTDSILHAWHRSFVTMLEEIEETRLKDQLAGILSAMAAEVPSLWTQSAGTEIMNGVLDADYFLAVARSLLSGSMQTGSLGQAARVGATIAAVNDLQPLEINLYGEPRLVDFSQFTVRGHYNNSLVLSNYFRAMMWCALADYRYAGFSTGVPGGSTNTLRELAGSVALSLLLQDSGQFTNWLQLNRILEMYVGTPDSLNFAQLNDILDIAGIHTPGDLPNEAALTDLQGQLMSGQLGMQQVTSGYYWSPMGPGQVKLPRSFSFMGQRFVMDSWALGKCTFDDIIWDEDGIPDVWDKVLRRVPGALDVAFAVFGNSQVVPELAARIADTNGHPWRDGLPYQHNLAATRNTIDAQEPSAWTNSIYTHWLACLRELSEPTTGSEYPQAMRTRPWAMKTLNTQLASWTELRHNTVLYAVQSYTPILLCSYPDGYVEPRPAFWAQIGEMALSTKAVLAMLPTNGMFHYYHPNPTNEFGYIEVVVSGATMHSNRLAVMDNFAQAAQTLDGISAKELNRVSLSTNETAFLEHIVEVNYVGERTYTGWFPSLFYEPASEFIPPDPTGQIRDTGDDKGSDYWDALVTDVHTDPPDPVVGDPGSILHEGVGNVQLLMIAVDCGTNDLAVYAGPVLSHYEFELGPTTRMTDSEWRARVLTNGLPPAPDWTRGYLVPTP